MARITWIRPRRGWRGLYGSDRDADAADYTDPTNDADDADYTDQTNDADVADHTDPIEGADVADHTDQAMTRVSRSHGSDRDADDADQMDAGHTRRR